MTAALEIRIHLTSVPSWCEAPLSVGLQRGRDELLRGDSRADGWTFVGAVRVKPGPDGEPDFAGPLVHGRRRDRFVYVSWGVDRDGSHDMFRRLKLYLGPLKRAAFSQPGISWALIEGGAVELFTPGRGPDGSPACGTARADWVAA